MPGTTKGRQCPKDRMGVVHRAHPWTDPPGGLMWWCQGYGEPGEGHAEPAPPCPMRTQQHPHAAHEWDGGEGRCPGHGEPEEGRAEPAPPQTAEERARDLEYTIQRVREAVGTDVALVSCEEHAARIEPLESALRGVLAMFEKQIEQRLLMGALSINTVRAWRNALDGDPS